MYSPISQNFNLVLNGNQISLITIRNSAGMEVSFTNYGARIVSLKVPDFSGKLTDVVLGFENIQDYLNAREPYYGATIGRYCNRISNSKFNLDGINYELTQNEQLNHLHGGHHGLHAVVWERIKVSEDKVVFKYISHDGDEGYPGKLCIKVTYTLTELNELIIEYEAETDKKTVINLTNHTYFNLNGTFDGSVADHMIKINAKAFTPINDSMIPTGEVKSVVGTVFDFNYPKPIGQHWDYDDNQLNIAGGFDHNFVLNNPDGNEQVVAAIVYEPKSGRMMEVKTTQPGVQFYTANMLSGKDVGREGIPYEPRMAFCLETQHFPDTPNQSQFPSAILNSGDLYQNKTTFRFFW